MLQILYRPVPYLFVQQYTLPSARGMCFCVGKGTGFSSGCLFVPCALLKLGPVQTERDFMRAANLPSNHATVQQPGRVVSLKVRSHRTVSGCQSICFTYKVNGGRGQAVLRGPGARLSIGDVWVSKCQSILASLHLMHPSVCLRHSHLIQCIFPKYF